MKTLRPVDDATAREIEEELGDHKPGLWKTTIVIWSSDDPQNYELADLAQEATDGNAKCTKCVSSFIKKPEADKDFEGAGDFFGSNADLE